MVIPGSTARFLCDPGRQVAEVVPAQLSAASSVRPADHGNVQMALPITWH